ncbi:cupin domain-containing protein [Nocardiopsis sp. RSe5-2]|uniref:Cupin domain-containing protein n=1 Tax=Nocardiopsis endophytica TaxID=3018445 RepID=A0ABT4U1V6_9ACTN|nr:cupin domain-containing protein [Nocardiopsis endophytica]MDA2810928.1 cupin domain-containing protein [Nocardiopsis endophytica]
MSTPSFPGAVAASMLEVYDWQAEDGLHGGTPHVHTASSEAYVVVAGRGEVHTLTPEGARVDALEPGTLLWFTPGTVHRLVNSGGLEIVVLMQNSGLPEAGDAVFTFPARILADRDAYDAAARLSQDTPAEERAATARARRDLAVEGYLELRAAVRREGGEALRRFHRLAADLVRPRVAEWERIWHEGAEREAERTRRQLASLAEGDPGLMEDATVVRTEPLPGPRHFGMCGRLHKWRPRRDEG